MPDLAGTVVSERYELGDVLGAGGQGAVYRARDRKTGRGVAVKMLAPGVAHNPEFAARLAREQEALVALAGTSAVAVYDLCRTPNGSLCLVMELLDGGDLELHLSELESRGERLSKERLCAIFEPVVDTLERAHDVGIVHRDVKPSNIFVLADGAGVRLLDFGLSRMQAAAPLTAAGMVVGSPSYIAPEIWRGHSEDVDGRADVYSLGVILFRCLSGELPFASDGLVETMRLVTTAPRPSPRSARPDLPKAVDAWAEKALSVDPAERFEGVRALYGGLLEALEYTPPPRAPRPVADSLVGAWRAATSVFRRFIDAASAGTPEPGSRRAAEPADLDDDESDRPTLEFQRQPPSIRPETAAIDDGWEEVADSEIHSSSPESQELRRTALSGSSDGAGVEVTDVEVEAVTGERAKEPSKTANDHSRKPKRATVTQKPKAARKAKRAAPKPVVKPRPSPAAKARTAKKKAVRKPKSGTGAVTRSDTTSGRKKKTAAKARRRR